MDEGITATSTFKSRWEDFYTGYSMHGVHFIFESKGIRRILWLLLLCGSFTLSIFLFEGTITDFLEYRTVAIREEIFGVELVEFPTVTICNLNSVSKQKIHELGLSDTDIAELYKSFRNKTMNPNDTKTMTIMQQLYSRGIKTPLNFAKHLELEIPDMMDDPVVIALSREPCSFRNTKCTDVNFTTVFSDKYGICQQFNSYYQLENRLHVNEAGEGFGLHLYLNIHEDDLLTSRVPYQGLAVFVHPFGTPFNSQRSTLVPVQPGTMSFIHVKMSNLQLLKSPYKSECVDEQLYSIVNSTIYSKPMCEADCIMKKVKEKCGCLPLHFIHLPGARPVCQFKDLSCELDFVGKYERLKMDCHKECPVECKYTKYEVSSDQTTLGTRITTSDIMSIPGWNLSRMDTIEYVRKNLVGMDVSFSDISYAKETISPTVTWTSLLGSIGGNIGLCLGASLITFVEFFVFCFDMLVKWMKIRCCVGNQAKESKKSDPKI